ncbi:hypothetical protein F383_29944 [Gossypium arboreum]|uniref:Uncharacterized protein n=1 Tax=Gossypium arboreum TaxID=29729 RepID=A0A0B0PCM2_GOSAR|nr:hypothetical protein F383_29944 [Gossypium arboreum]
MYLGSILLGSCLMYYQSSQLHLYFYLLGVIRSDA